jgi:RNA polymerase sigma-70 factor (ECF subfamily)
MGTLPAAGIATPVSYQKAMSAEREERRLLERIRAGDREAAEALVEESYAAIFASLVRLCGGDRDLAADLTQETYRKAWQALASFDGRSRFSTWLYRIAYNLFLNRLRRPLRAVSLEGDGVPIPADPTESAEDSLGSAETSLRLRRAVLALPDELRFPVTARFWAGQSVSEIARHEEVTTVAIRKRLRRALTSLQAALQEDLS